MKKEIYFRQNESQKNQEPQEFLLKGSEIKNIFLEDKKKRENFRALKLCRCLERFHACRESRHFASCSVLVQKTF
jgi:hypothetical protein